MAIAITYTTLIIEVEGLRELQAGGGGGGWGSESNGRRVIIKGPEPPQTEVFSYEAGGEVSAGLICVGPVSLVEADVPSPFVAEKNGKD